jgi:hypothetical protein
MNLFLMMQFSHLVWTITLPIYEQQDNSNRWTVLQKKSIETFKFQVHLVNQQSRCGSNEASLGEKPTQITEL